MMTDFNFIGFTPDDDMKKKAYIVAERLLDMSPYGSMVAALLQKDDVSYRCAIEIYSKHGPFIAQASDTNPDSALENVVRSLSKKLEHWKEARRFSAHVKAIQRVTSVA